MKARQSIASPLPFPFPFLFLRPLPQGYVLSDKNSSRFVIGGALGEMLVPAFIAWLLGPNSIDDDVSSAGDGEASGQPAALYGACVAVSALLVAVYGTWFSLLGAAAVVSSP